MTHLTPVVEGIEPVGRGTEVGEGREPLAWDDAERRLNSDGWCWLTSVRPDGSPHLVPVLAVWSESVAFVSSKDSARKSRNLAADGRCALAADVDGAHLVVEGVAEQVRDRERLERASAAFLAVYGWPTTVTGDQLDAEYGAPTSGGPPYGVWAVAPTKAFALPTDGAFLPTRWRF